MTASSGSEGAARLTTATVASHAHINNFAFRVGCSVKKERSGALSFSIVGGEVEFNVHPPRSLLIVNRPDAPSNGEYTPAAGQQNAAAAEAIVTGLSVEQNNVAWNRFIDQTAAEHRDSERTLSGVAGSIGRSTRHGSYAHRECRP